MICNRCGGLMVPDDAALVPAMRCVQCGRLVPRSAVKYKPSESQRAELNRALRAHRRMKAARDG